MDDYESLSHTKWECKHHVVFIPNCRRKVLHGTLRRHLGEVFRRLAEQKECRIEEGYLLADHVHMMISIPPKYSVSSVVGFIKGKSAIRLARVYGEQKQNDAGQSFWARWYFVSTIGRDEAVIRDFKRDSSDMQMRVTLCEMRLIGFLNRSSEVRIFPGSPLLSLRIQHCSHHGRPTRVSRSIPFTSRISTLKVLTSPPSTVYKY